MATKGLVAIALTLALTASAAAQNGKPDLSGMWGGGGGGAGRNFDDSGTISSATSSRRCAPGQPACTEQTNQSFDQEFVREDVINGEVWFSGRWSPNKPLYRPEHWDRIQFLDENTNTYDPILQCQPQGITREDPPTRIVQLANEIIVFYGGDYFRIIPTDGRKHDPNRAVDITYWGHSVGRWEGDTLVIESVGFNDSTWLMRGGMFTSDNMRIVERLRREGNVLAYDITVHDPTLLLEPWVTNTRRLRLNTNPNAFLPEGAPCRDYDSENLVTKIRH